MRSTEQNKASLIESIERDAQDEAQRLVDEANKIAAERHKYVDQQVESIVHEAKEKAKTQAAQIRKKVLAGVEIEVKRHRMQLQDSLYKEIVSAVSEQLESLAQGSDYKDVVRDWVVEASIGLGSDRATILCSDREMQLVDGELLQTAENMVFEYTGKNITLSLDTTSSNDIQGIQLINESGTLAFNNQVATRLLRKEREIRKYLYNNLFSEHSDNPENSR